MDAIIGKWIGEYTYGDDYEEEMRGKSVKFSMELHLDGELIRGVCIDEETREIFSEPSKIEGTFENGTLMFYLRYPDTPGPGVSDDAAKKYNSTSIQYIGVWNKNFFTKGFFEGTWEIDGAFLDENGDACYYSCEGTWTMRKA